jgi:hypothetical protein
MKDIATFVVTLFKDLNARARWIAIFVSLLTLVAALAGYEYLTRDIFYDRLERRVALLGELQQIADQGIATHPELYPIYQAVVRELSERRLDTVLSPPLSGADPVTVWKAVSGGVVWLLILAIGLGEEIGRTKSITGETAAVGVMLVLVALLYAVVGAAIPTLYNPWVNYIGFPLLQLAVLYLLSRGSKGAQGA